MDFDFTQFFNPSAWGSWMPSATQTLVSPAQNAPTPPWGAAPAAPAAPMNIMSPTANAAAAPAQGQGGSGLGGIFGKGTPANNMMANLGMSFLKPQMPAPPQIQMARPVGPGQMPAASAPFGSNMTWGGPNPSSGQTPTTMTQRSDGSAPQWGFGTPRQLGMLGGYGF